MNCVNRGDASPSPVRPCVMRMAAVEKRGKNVEKWRSFDRHRHYSPGKPDAFPAQNALKSGVEHQISVSRKASIFSGFSCPLFHRCHAASRKDGRAAARLVVGAGGEVWIRPDGRIGVRLL